MQNDHDIETEFSSDVAAYEVAASYAVAGICAGIAFAVIVSGHFGAAAVAS